MIPRPAVVPALLAALLCVLMAGASTRAPEGRPLDALAARVMRGHSGTAVFLDVRSGTLLGVTNERVAAARLAPPGSAIKPFTLEAMLQARHGRSPNGFLCPRRIVVGNRRLDCSHPEPPAGLAAEQALAYSCNGYFVQLAKQLKPGELERALRTAGFTSPTGLLPHETPGVVLDASTDSARQWMALGVAGVQVTPLQLAQAYRNLVLRMGRDPRLEPLRQGMLQATQYGSAQLAAVEGLPMLAKTGTAPYGAGRTHAWFVGAAPAEAPEIVVLVFLERGRGGADAARIAHQLFTAWKAERR